MEDPMMPSLRARRDPWWDLEGVDARQHRVRLKVVTSSAFAVAVVACGLTIAAWVQELWPAVSALRIG